MNERKRPVMNQTSNTPKQRHLHNENKHFLLSGNKPATHFFDPGCIWKCSCTTLLSVVHPSNSVAPHTLIQVNVHKTCATGWLVCMESDSHFIFCLEACNEYGQYEKRFKGFSKYGKKYKYRTLQCPLGFP